MRLHSENAAFKLELNLSKFHQSKIEFPVGMRRGSAVQLLMLQSSAVYHVWQLGCIVHLHGIFATAVQSRYLSSTSNRKHNPKSFDYIIKEIKYKDIFLLDSIKYVYSMHYIHWVKYEGKYF